MNKLQMERVGEAVHYGTEAQPAPNPHHMKIGMSDAQRRQLMSLTNIQTLLLFEAYLRSANKGGDTELDDQVYAERLGLTKRSIIESRRKLQRIGWLFAEHSTNAGKRTHTQYYLGKAVVAHRQSRL